MKKADLAVFGFAADNARIKVVHFLPSVSFGPKYFFTKYPDETTKMWNLLYLFTPTSWMWTFLSIASIVVSLKIFGKIAARLGLNSLSEEISLFPFRCAKQLKSFNNQFFIYIFRIRIVETHDVDRDSFLPRGFSQNFCFLIWSVFGGILM